MSFDHGFIMHLYKVEQHIFMAINSSSAFEKHIFFFLVLWKMTALILVSVL